MQLLKVQRNALLESIIAGGLDPADCELGKLGQSEWTMVHHKSSGSKLLVASQDGVHFVLETIIGEGSRQFNLEDLEWPNLLPYVEEWASSVIIDANTPDMWEELRQGGSFFNAFDREGKSNSPFTPAELTAISRQLREIIGYIRKTCSLGDEQLALMEARFDEAEAASRRMGRKDWFLLFGGVLLTLIISGVLTPEVVQHVLLLTGHGIGHLFSGRSSRPQIPPPHHYLT